MQTSHKVEAIQCITVPKNLQALARMPQTLPKGKRSLKYCRKTTKDLAMRTSKAGKTLPTLCERKVIKNGRILSENGRLEMIAQNGRVGISGVKVYDRLSDISPTLCAHAHIHMYKLKLRYTACEAHLFPLMDKRTRYIA